MNSSIKLHKSLLLMKRNFSQINFEMLLSEENKRKTIEKFKKYTKLRVGERNTEKHAAILIPLCITNNEISILYTIRSSKLRNYSGQVCFPGNGWITFTFALTRIQPKNIFLGGKMDDTDYHEFECALRETEEEIGLSSEFIEVSNHSTIQTSIIAFLSLADMGSGITNHAKRRAIDSANHRWSSKLRPENAEKKSRRSWKDFHDSPWPPLWPESRPTHTVSNPQHVRLLDAGFPRWRHEVLGNDRYCHTLPSLLITAKTFIQSTSAICQQIRDVMIRRSEVTYSAFPANPLQ